LVLVRISKRLGAEVLYETGLFDPQRGLKNYRVPDLVVIDPASVSKRGVEGKPTLVVEVLSPNDESRDKLPFYGAMGVREVWLIDPNSHTVEVFTLRAGKLTTLKPRGGMLRSPALGVELETVKGKLRIRDGEQIDLV
jgi:Uma2 family endonuclease